MDNYFNVDLIKQVQPVITKSDVDVMKRLIESIEEAENTLESDSKVSDHQIAKDIAFMKDLIQQLNRVEKSTSEIIRDRIVAAGSKFHANSNISAFIEEGEIDELINECTEAFEKVLDCLVIDRENDPNSIDTPRRLAKMYILETMSGRYNEAPKVTAFPNTHTQRTDGYNGLLVVRSELRSLCSHHHQPVTGVAYIGIIPKGDVIGLSKYTRLAQFAAKRGTLQEELAADIAELIQTHSGSEDVAVYIEAEHGCCTNRGIMAHNSTTQTTVLKGEFMTDPAVRKEFHDNISLQKMQK